MSDKIHMPSSMGGLVSYTSDYDSKIVFKPAYVIVFCVVVILIAVFLHLYGNAILGI
jgi:preprotein translocase subunit Sec61beta